MANRTEAELERRWQAVLTDNQRLVQELAAFLAQYYPPPANALLLSATGTETGAIPDDRHADATISRAEAMSLRDFLEALMNRFVEQPADPWVLLTARHWPPYVELLVRAGIAERHPSDARRLRVVDFTFGM